MSIDQTLLARIQEIIAKSAAPITAVDAAMQALADMYPNPADHLRLAARFAVGSTRALKIASYEIPEPSGQLELFDIPAHIVVETDKGDLWVPRPLASTDQTRSWVDAAERRASTQLYRARSAKKDLQLVKDVDGLVPWLDTREILEDRKRKQLENPEGDTESGTT